MKIAITGHSRGIGKSLTDKLSSAGHTVIGFSRVNGYNISADINRIVNQSLDCDVFINNAGCQFKQIELFQSIFDAWQHEHKLIVNINSRAGYMLGQKHVYPASKRELSKIARCTVLPERKCKVTNIYPGYVDTDLVTHVQDQPKLTVDECTDMIMWAISAPRHVEVGELGFWCAPGVTV